jgi:hypothetical protein
LHLIAGLLFMPHLRLHLCLRLRLRLHLCVPLARLPLL